MARRLRIRPEAEPQLLWLAVDALGSDLPSGWELRQLGGGYSCASTGEETRERPLAQGLDYWLDRVAEARHRGPRGVYEMAARHPRNNGVQQATQRALLLARRKDKGTTAALHGAGSDQGKGRFLEHTGFPGSDAGLRHAEQALSFLSAWRRADLVTAVPPMGARSAKEKKAIREKQRTAGGAVAAGARVWLDRAQHNLQNHGEALRQRLGAVKAAREIALAGERISA